MLQKKFYGHQAAIMEVLGMAGKLLRNISPDKIENRDVEYYKQALDLTGCPTITASNNYIPPFQI